MLVSEADISSLLPQRPPFIMVDSLVEASSEHVYTRFLIQADNVFVDNARFSAAGLIEHLAQSAAVGIAYLHQLNQPPDHAGASPAVEGFLAAISHLDLHTLPRVGDQLDTRIRPLKQFGRMLLIQGQIKCAGELLMEGRMKLAAGV